MRKVILFLGLLVGSMVVRSQEIKIGPTAGFNFSEYRINDPYNDFLKTPMILRLHLGATAEMELRNRIVLKSGLNFVARGGKLVLSEELDGILDNGESIFLDADLKYKTVNLEIPLLVGYNLPLSYVDITVFTGPTLGFALWGKVKSEATGSSGGIEHSEESTQSIDFGDDMKRSDIGWEFAASVGLENFNIPVVASISYNLGLNNINAVENDDFEIRNRTLSISATYFLKTF